MGFFSGTRFIKSQCAGYLRSHLFLVVLLPGVPKPGVFWVLTPPLFWAYNPHFLEGLKNGSWREAQQKLGELEKNLGGNKIFREGKKFQGEKIFRGRKNGGLSKKKEKKNVIKKNQVKQSKKKVELTAKSMKFEQFFVQTLYSKIDISHKKMDQLVGFLLHPPLSEIGKKKQEKC